MKSAINNSYLLLFGLILLFSLLPACERSVPVKPTVVQGYVRDEQGKPVAGARLNLTAVNSSVFSGRRSRDYGDALTDNNGYYKFSVAIEREYDAPTITVNFSQIGFDIAIVYQKMPSGQITNSPIAIFGQTNEMDWILTRR